MGITQKGDTIRMSEKRDINELIQIVWNQIDNCVTHINNSNLSNRDKQMWTQNLVALIGRLDKLMWKTETKEQVKEDLAQLLETIPKKYHKKLKKWCSRYG